MTAVKNVGVCDFCQDIKIKRNDFVYRIGFDTNLGEFNVGIMNIYEELSNFLMDRGSHLSASQVILLRPDILKTFIKFKYKTEYETIDAVYLCESEICPNCFKLYVKEIPER